MINYLKIHISEFKLITLLEMFKYFWVSVIAAVVDYASFMLGYSLLGIGAYAANALGFVLGLSVNYALSVSFVFKREANKSPKEFVLFALIGIVGLAVSMLTISITLETLSLNASFAKIIAIATTFFWNFGARKILLFSKKV